MSQRERDRLKVLHELSKGQLTQKEAGSQLQLSTRQVRRLMVRYREAGDRSVMHGLRGRPSNRRIDASTEERAISELKKPECRDFGPTFAAEHLGKILQLQLGKDTVRKWMMAAGLWKASGRKVKEIHQWRERRSCCGELVQWDTSVHDWLEGRGERLYLIAMIDDATSRLFARFVEHDSAAENMRVLRSYLETYGRPLGFYTDKAAMFETAAKQSLERDVEPPAQTQITRALAELGIGRISAHSPQAKGRVERCFGTLQDRLVKSLRLAGVANREQANRLLMDEFLPDWNQRFVEAAKNPVDAHRPLAAEHNLTACLSHVEKRRIANDYTIQFQGKRFQIARADVKAGMKGQYARVEARLDGSFALRFQGTYVAIAACGARSLEPPPTQNSKPVRKDTNRGGRSRWMTDFPVNINSKLPAGQARP